MKMGGYLKKDDGWISREGRWMDIQRMKIGGCLEKEDGCMDIQRKEIDEYLES